MRLDLSLSPSHLQQSSLHDASTRREIPSQYAANPLPPRHFLSEYLSLPLGISLYLFPSLSLSLFTFLPSLMYPHYSPLFVFPLPDFLHSESFILFVVHPFGSSIDSSAVSSIFLLLPTAFFRPLR